MHQIVLIAALLSALASFPGVHRATVRPRPAATHAAPGTAAPPSRPAARTASRPTPSRRIRNGRRRRNAMKLTSHPARTALARRFAGAGPGSRLRGARRRRSRSGRATPARAPRSPSASRASTARRTASTSKTWSSFKQTAADAITVSAQKLKPLTLGDFPQRGRHVRDPRGALGAGRRDRRLRHRGQDRAARLGRLPRRRHLAVADLAAHLADQLARRDRRRQGHPRERRARRARGERPAAKRRSTSRATPSRSTSPCAPARNSPRTTSWLRRSSPSTKMTAGGSGPPITYNWRLSAK